MPKGQGILNSFYRKADGDQKISPSHISVYMALVHIFLSRRLKNPIVINRLEIMKRAKINSRNTFGKCLHELHLYGYIDYRPSFNPGCTEIDIRLQSG
jgi:hypothetical protein